MFREHKCNFCGVCLHRCYYLNFNKDEGSKEMKKLVKGEKVDWLKDCVTCMACNEYCHEDARPFDLILSRLEEYGNFVDPEMIKQMSERFRAKREPRPVEIKGKVMSMCVMEGNMPWVAQGQLFENLTILKGLPYFCNVLFVHMGNESIMRDKVGKLVENYAKSGAKEIIFAHEDCYALLKGMAPEYGIELPFKPIHLFEYLLDFLEENKNKISKLNIKVAYQRPCASRHTPAKIEEKLNAIFNIIGVERVERRYDNSNALCCGVENAGPNLKLFPRGENFEPFRNKNIQDAFDSGAEAMVYMCPMCFKALHQKANNKGLKNYMITDICRLALGEQLSSEKPE